MGEELALFSSTDERLTPYFESEGVRLYHGDCLKLLPPLFGDKSVDVVITDPPYEAEAHTRGRRVKRGVVPVAAVLPFPPITETVRKTAAYEMARITRRWILTFCQIEAVHEWRSVYELAGARYMRTCLWRKTDGQPQLSGDRPGLGYETILTMYGCEQRSKWNGRGRHGVFTHPKGDGRPRPHPTTKPLRLMNELVSLFSDPGELVVDPFAGSGSTLLACRDLGRRVVGIELDERYCEIAANRLRQGVLAI